MTKLGFACAAALLAVVFSIPQEKITAHAMAPLTGPVPGISSCEVPTDVASGLPQDLYDQIPFFDDYSWKAFAALICDAKQGDRGVPDPANGRDGKGARVFETFKSAWEVYHPGKVSGVWGSYESQSNNPCKNAPQGELVLASTSKLIDVMQSGLKGVALAPLPAQNGTYVRYLTEYNQESFEYIVPTLTATSPSIQFPNRSINLKSAWVEMKGLKVNPDRFYTRWAWIPRSGGNCEKTEVGLVGLHIVQKTPSKPHWIWSTFEQVDNAPDATACPSPTPGGPYTFNNGNCHDPMPNWPPSDNLPNLPPKTLFNVVRTEALINLKTQATNQAYQKLFDAKSKWQYYQLVMTQWPIENVAPGDAGDPRYTFPTTSTTSAFANTVMETFFQTNRKFSCLGCHAAVGSSFDFVWSRNLEPQSSRGPALKLLRKTLEKSGMVLH